MSSYDTKNSASFGTVQKLYKEAKKLKSDLKLTQVKNGFEVNWLILCILQQEQNLKETTF